MFRAVNDAMPDAVVGRVRYTPVTVSPGLTITWVVTSPMYNCPIPVVPRSRFFTSAVLC